MDGWMGLICFLAYVWIMYRSTTGRVFERGEMWMLSVIMMVAAVRFLWAWNREAYYEAYNEYLRGQSIGDNQL